MKKNPSTDGLEKSNPRIGSPHRFAQGFWEEPIIIRVLGENPPGEHLYG